MKQVAGRLKGDLAQFRELAAFAQFGSELDPPTQAKIDRGRRIMELFNQPQHDPLSFEEQVALLWAVQNGYFDRIELTRVKQFQQRLTEYLASSDPDLLAQIAGGQSLDDAVTAKLRSVCDAFTHMWK
jgi:F-type H+-transporting ATPase subunit alpha